MAIKIENLTNEEIFEKLQEFSITEICDVEGLHEADPQIALYFAMVYETLMSSLIHTDDARREIKKSGPRGGELEQFVLGIATDSGKALASLKEIIKVLSTSQLSRRLEFPE